MKKFVIVLCLLVLAQVPQAQNKFNDNPFIIAVGFVPGVFTPGTTDLNNRASAFGVPEFPKIGVPAIGFSGMVTPGFIPFLRLGFMELSGSVSESGTSQGFQKEISYSASLWGLTVEYSLPWFRKYSISLGCVVGKGSRSIQVSRNADGPYSWENEWGGLNNPVSTVGSYTRTFSNTFFTITPTLNFDYPLAHVLSLRVGTGYVIPFSTTWKMDNDQTVNDMPGGITKGSFYYTIGLHAGLLLF